MSRYVTIPCACAANALGLSVAPHPHGADTPGNAYTALHRLGPRR